MHKRIFEIIELFNGSDFWSSVYDYFMIIIIVASLIPLASKQDIVAFSVIDHIVVAVFIIDYLLRLCTADLKI